MVIDVHAHIFPATLAQRASQNIGAFYDLHMGYDGTVDTLLRCGKLYGIERFVVHSAATTPEQVYNINTFIATEVKSHPAQLIGFGTLHPESPTLEKDLQYCKKLGLHGIKLHPDFQKFHLDSAPAMELFARLEGQFPVLVHTGDRRSQYSKASRLAKVAETFPRLDIIAAHFGGFSEWENGALALAQSGVYVDTSSSQFALRPHQVRELIDIYGPRKVLFGTDYPMWNGREELEGLEKIPMADWEREAIYHQNLEELLERYDPQRR